MGTIAKITATAAVTLAAGLSLTACGTAAKAPAHTSHTSHATAPAAAVAAPVAAMAAPTADGTLASDGYTVVTDETPAEITASGGTAAQYITSAGGGIITSGTLTAEAVIIISPAGVHAIGGTTASVTTAMQAQVKAGETVTVTGAPDGSDVIRVGGTASSF